jgi:hypothetical protein
MKKKSKGIVNTVSKPIKASVAGATEILKDPTGVKF